MKRRIRRSRRVTPAVTMTDIFARLADLRREPPRIDFTAERSADDVIDDEEGPVVTIEAARRSAYALAIQPMLRIQLALKLTAEARALVQATEAET